MKRMVLFILFVGVFVATSVAVDANVSEGDRSGMPDSHRVDWIEKHQNYSKSNTESCTMCHNSYYCINCHSRRDTIKQTVHRRNFKFYHSIQARSNPRKCDACHKPSYCTDCHRNPR